MSLYLVIKSKSYAYLLNIFKFISTGFASFSITRNNFKSASFSLISLGVCVDKILDFGNLKYKELYVCKDLIWIWTSFQMLKATLNDFNFRKLCIFFAQLFMKSSSHFLLVLMPFIWNKSCRYFLPVCYCFLVLPVVSNAKLFFLWCCQFTDLLFSLFF